MWRHCVRIPLRRSRMWGMQGKYTHTHTQHETVMKTWTHRPLSPLTTPLLRIPKLHTWLTAMLQIVRCFLHVLSHTLRFFPPLLRVSSDAASNRTSATRCVWRTKTVWSWGWTVTAASTAASRSVCLSACPETVRTFRTYF